MELKEYNEKGFTKYLNFFDKEFIDKVNIILDEIIMKEKDRKIETVFFENDTDKIKQIQYLTNYDQIFIIIKDKLTGSPLQLFEKHPHISKIDNEVVQQLHFGLVYNGYTFNSHT